MAIGQGHLVCWQEPAEKMRQEEAKLWRKMIKERMGERWEVNRQPRERKRLNQDRRMAVQYLIPHWGCRTY